MTGRGMLSGSIAVLFSSGLTTGGEFVPGHIFVSHIPNIFCAKPPEIEPPDRILEIDPETGEFSLFVELPECKHMTGLTFTPDGTRLRASALVTSEILEFDPDGKFTVVLDADDGISGPGGTNNITYDGEGNFYVVNAGSNTLMRFPPDGGPGTVLADWDDHGFDEIDASTLRVVQNQLWAVKKAIAALDAKPEGDQATSRAAATSGVQKELKTT